MSQFQNFSAIQIFREINFGLEMEISESLLRSSILREINFGLEMDCRRVEISEFFCLLDRFSVKSILDWNGDHGNVEISEFFDLRFYVKSILGVMEVQKLPFFPFWGL